MPPVPSSFNYRCPTCDTLSFVPPDFAGEPVCPKCLFDMSEKQEHETPSLLFYMLACGFLTFFFGLLVGFAIGRL